MEERLAPRRSVRAKGPLELIRIGGAAIGRATFAAGWRWATSVQPLAKTKRCEAPHFQINVSSVLHELMDDGTEFDCRPGDVSLLPSGHDAWTVGEEPAIVVDVQGMIDYAKSRRREHGRRPRIAATAQRRASLRCDLPAASPWL